MPTYQARPRFLRDYKNLTRKQAAAWDSALDLFIACLRRGRFEPSLRVKRTPGSHEEVWNPWRSASPHAGLGAARSTSWRHRSIRSLQTDARRWGFPGLGDTFKIMASAQTAPTRPLKVGDHVAANVPGIDWKGIVVEDRGPLGLDGRQIVVIRVGNEDEGRRFEVRAEYLERVAA
ncbi:MAG: hypothetical protein ACRDLF_03830 [Solirubrobacteraceae bacterium]